MSHPPADSHPQPTTGRLAEPIGGGVAAASIGLGFFSLVVFWWTPFSSILASVGLILGTASLIRGSRGPRGENYALAGTALCATSLSITITLNQVFHYLMWAKLF